MSVSRRRRHLQLTRHDILAGTVLVLTLWATPAAAEEGFSLRGLLQAFPGLQAVMIRLESDELLGRGMELEVPGRETGVARLSASVRLTQARRQHVARRLLEQAGFGHDDDRDQSEPALLRLPAIRFLRERVLGDVSAKLVLGVERQLDESSVGDMRGMVGGAIEYSF